MTPDLREQLQRTLGSAYTLERELGRGGMSRVFVAEEMRFHRHVVVKVLSPELAAAISVQRFEREIMLAAQLQQANIVSVITAGESDGLPYFTMPFVEGQSLRDRLAHGPLPIIEATSVLRDVARALAYAHARGIVHRDIKPDNVLLSGAAAVVTDFGIAKALAVAAGERTDDGGGMRLTMVGTSIGTPAYMAPEQAAGDQVVDHRADIYAFGCMAYELLTGVLPFRAGSSLQMLLAHMSESPRPIEELRPDLPPLLAGMIMATLAKDPNDRPQSATDLMNALEDVGARASHAIASAIVGGQGMLRRAFAAYAATFVVVFLLAKWATNAVGLPDWVVPGALVIMALGLPLIAFTAYSHRMARRLARTPTRTPGGTMRAPSAGTIATIAVKVNRHLTWHRAMFGGVYSIGAFAILVGLFMALRALGIGPFGSLLAAGTLDQRQPLIITEFKTVNSDSTFGSVVSQAVRSNLEQSDVIAIVPQENVTQALQRMKQPLSARFDLARARELSVREGVKAIVDGEVDGVGSGYLITLRLVTVDSARELASFREAADGLKEVMGAVDILTRKLRGRIGESLRDVRASPPLAQVTTGSLDALRKYTASVQATSRLDLKEAARLIREAIALDTSFALAYVKLAESGNNVGVTAAERDSAVARAFRMRDRLPERERLLVEGHYYGSLARDRTKAIAAYDSALSRGLYTGANSLVILLFSRREFARADTVLRLQMRIDPQNAAAYSADASLLVSTGRLAAADSLLAVSTRLFPSNAIFALRGMELRYFRDGPDAAARYADSVRGTVTGPFRATLLRERAMLAQLRGRLKERDDLLHEASVIDVARAATRYAVTDSLDAIWRDALLLPPSPKLIERVDAVMAQPHSTERRPEFMLAQVYAIAGQPDKARAALARYESETKDSLRRRADLPFTTNAQGEIALAERRPADAIVEFLRADRRPDGPALSCATCLFIKLARAYDAAGNVDSAAAMIERYVQRPSIQRFENDATYLAPFLKRLGEIQEAKGNKAKAAVSYQRFIDLWKDADAGLQPKVRDARLRLDRLRALDIRTDRAAAFTSP